MEDDHTYYVSDIGVLVHNECVVNQKGVKIESYYPNDHGNPVHLHVRGGGKSTKIGPKGYVVKGYPPLSPKQAKVVADNIKTIKRYIRKKQRWIKKSKKK